MCASVGGNFLLSIVALLMVASASASEDSRVLLSKRADALPKKVPRKRASPQSCQAFYNQNHLRLAGPGADRGAWISHLMDGRKVCQDGFNSSIYDIPKQKWIQTNYVGNQMHPQEHFFWDKDAQTYTVDRYLQDLKSRFGGLDSLVIWPSYPNLGIDDRNQFDLFRSMPGGLEGFKKLIGELHSKGVHVMLAFNPWDTNTRDEGGTFAEALGRFAKEVDADGYLMDTCVGASKDQHEECPFCGFQSEGYTNAFSSPYTTLSDAKGVWDGLAHEPAADIVKWSVDSRWMSMGEFRGSWDYTNLLHQMFFNGAGLNAWEDVWGDYHEMVPHDSELLRRIATINRYFGKKGFLTSKDWMPFAEEVESDIGHGTKFPIGGDTVFTIVNKEKTGGTATVNFAPGDGARYFDCYAGVEFPHGAALKIALEPLGIGCVFATTAPPEDLPAFLKTMADLTVVPLQNFTFVARRDPHIRRLVYHNSSSSPMNLDADRMVSFEATSYHFKTSVTACESGALQYPWEHGPTYTHDASLDLAPFSMDKYPVTNQDYKAYLEQTSYSPQDTTNWLRDWSHSGKAQYPDGYAKKPVTWVNMQEAMDYCAWRGARLPQSFEWQHAAQGNSARLYPWGDQPGTDGVHLPAPATDRANPIPADVDAHPQGCSAAGVCDLVGNVWQFTDLFESERVLEYVLRGSSTYARFLANDLQQHGKGSGYYFPCIGAANGKDGGLKLDAMSHFLGMGNSSYERSGTVGFRCAVNAPAPSPAPPAPPTPPAPPSPPVPPSAWEKHEGINCYADHGAKALDGVPYPYSNQAALTDCQAACQAHSTCEGIVMPAEAKGGCWLLQDLNVDSCLPGPTYSLWKRSRSTIYI